MASEISELLKKLRKIEISIQKKLNNTHQGNYKSVFRGSGIEFDDVRSYQYGDDVRTINWTVTAKGHGAFVNMFKEDKEQQVFFVVDVSASQFIGKSEQKKIDIAKEVTGVLALSACKTQSNIGLICFSDQKEKYIKPSKGLPHVYSMIHALYTLNPKSRKTNINLGVNILQNLVKKRSLVVVISDFIDTEYHNSLASLAFKHDLVVIQISDLRETNLPRLGILPVFDTELKKTFWVNTSSKKFRKEIIENHRNNTQELLDLSKRNKISHLRLFTGEDYVPKLIEFFKQRASRR
ncbi:MAG: DUF58 domain-containing protein [Cytophagales bacterium]